MEKAQEENNSKFLDNDMNFGDDSKDEYDERKNAQIIHTHHGNITRFNQR